MEGTLLLAYLGYTLANLARVEVPIVQVNVLEAKNNLSALLKLLEEGKEESIVIARNGKPVAKMVAYAPVDVSKRIGIAVGVLPIPDDKTLEELDREMEADFEESLDELPY